MSAFLLNTLQCQSSLCQGAWRHFRLSANELRCPHCFANAPAEALAAPLGGPSPLASETTDSCAPPSAAEPGLRAGSFFGNTMWGDTMPGKAGS